MNGKKPYEITVSGHSFLQKSIEDVVFAVLKWENNITYHLNLI